MTKTIKKIKIIRHHMKRVQS